MTITNIYLEDGVICIKIQDFDHIIYLDNHSDNRALLNKFQANKPKSSNIERKFIEEELNDIEEEGYN
tara:strand:- start:5645 stop:5848 length:204 start_codon:yes stop_codon:yes gene_type:complete